MRGVPARGPSRSPAIVLSSFKRGALAGRAGAQRGKFDFTHTVR